MLYSFNLNGTVLREKNKNLQQNNNNKKGIILKTFVYRKCQQVLRPTVIVSFQF